MRRKILKTTSVFLLAVALFMIQAPVTAWGDSYINGFMSSADTDRINSPSMAGDGDVTIYVDNDQGGAGAFYVVDENGGAAAVTVIAADANSVTLNTRQQQ